MALSRGSRWFLAFGALALGAVAGGLWYVDTTWFADEVVAGEPVEYNVERGATVRMVGDDLAELGVLRSPVRFRLRADETGLAQSLQPGLFELETGMDIDEAIEVLAAGPLAPPSIRFTVREGYSVEQTLEELAGQFDAFEVEDFEEVLDARLQAGADAPGLLRIPSVIPEPSERDEDIFPFEGVFFPETYEIDDQASARDVLQLMADQLTVQLGRIPEDQREGMSDEELYEKLIIASLIERETRVDEERSTVAGVIRNRLDDGMQLQIDATVVFAVGGAPEGIVLLEDLEVDSPYNTYRIGGLPPGPIAGFGAAALRAAFDPADVPFFFYVLDPACDGTHRFAETGEEHNANVADFREAGRCQDVFG
ncbi:MAG: endolytic transglycosylase MltG [Nitriliruptoraceae bacterium]|nr:endolytic transglycosylase MltG [Nitriliruptoraceae bacterium]